MRFVCVVCVFKRIAQKPTQYFFFLVVVVSKKKSLIYCLFVCLFVCLLDNSFLFSFIYFISLFMIKFPRERIGEFNVPLPFQSRLMG